MIRHLAFLCVVAALHTGCSAAAGSGSQDVSGTWSGTYADAHTGVTGPLSASFSEESGTLGGTITIGSGWLCSASTQGNVNGNVNGDEVQATASFGLITALSFSGTASNGSISGAYSITSGVCAGGTGSFSLSR